MGDCNFSLPFPNNPENKEKFCKFSYSSWCATCEKASPRRRSRSETNETCKKKCKEMKTLTPKKYNRCNEYENMELEYDYKGWHETKYDCCRIRSNLVELPTSYISNNCQLPSNMSLARNDIDHLKIPKSYDYPNSFEFKPPFETLEAKEPNAKPMENGRKITLKSSNGFQVPKAKLFCDNQDVQNANLCGSEIKISNCREFCSLADFKDHSMDNRKPLCFNTDTYFNRPVDKDRYTREVDYLREKLRVLRNSAYAKHEVSVINLDMAKGGDSLSATPMEIRPRIVKWDKPQGRPVATKSKISLKTKKAMLNKARRAKSKSSVGATETVFSDDGSESDVVEDSILDEDPPSLASDESTKSSKVTSGSSTSASQNGAGECAVWPVRSSLFPNIPPYIKFSSHELDTPYKLPAGKKHFKWKLCTVTPILVRKILSNSGFALVRSEFSRESNHWLGQWGKHMKSPMFKTLKETQKLNHFPGTFHLGRKDRLWRNFQRMIAKYGLKEFGFLPHTFVLPQELKLLKQNWDFKNSGKEMWIIKPPASARGLGIKVINKWSQLPKKTSLVCQKYISNPYLINGSKFDIRLYVLVTSFHPLRIYLYPDGLARFASTKYSDDIKDLKDRYMHLTNYSINKFSSQYTANEDANACQGHKWTLTKLMEFLHNEGVDTKTLWKNMQQLVIKTIISSEALITRLCEENMNNYYNCYELFGIDVLLDEHLKPWLLEVNISPSLHSASPLDAHVKGPLVQTLLDMAQYHFPVQLEHSVKNAPKGYDPRIYTRALTKKERRKHVAFTQFESRDDYVYEILNELTGDDVRQLLKAEDEYVVKGKFERIFPTQHSHKYLQFMESRYYNRLFDAWETKYASRKEDGIALLQTLCAEKVHLKVGSQTALTKNGQNTILVEEAPNLQPSLEGQTRHLEDIMQNTTISTSKEPVLASEACKA